MSQVILGIETATKICSVAISKGNQVLALREEGGEYSHAEKLNGFIEECMKQAGITWEEIDAIAVSKGPGSYTGLRIGVSTAKGLCYALGKPLIAVETLQAMALQMAKEHKEARYYCPMIDARRMEVYTAVYDVSNNQVEKITAKIVEAGSFDHLLEHKTVFFGDGAAKCCELLSENSNAVVSSKGMPSAAAVNSIAMGLYEHKKFEDVAYFEPYYLKDFIATTAKKLL